MATVGCFSPDQQVSGHFVFVGLLWGKGAEIWLESRTTKDGSLPRYVPTTGKTAERSVPAPVVVKLRGSAGTYLVTANSATIRASTSIPFAKDARGMRSSSPCMRFRSFWV